MARSHTERVRLDEEEEELLQNIAKALDLSKSEVLRRGIAEMKEVADRVQARREHWDELLVWADRVPGDDVRPEGRV